MDWNSIFVPSLPLAEIVVRGTITYLAIFMMLRFFLKREAGAVSITDMLVIVMIADAAQNAMAGGYQSITEGIVLVLTIVFWSFTIDWMGHRFPALRRFLSPPPLSLVEDGRMITRNMRKELITEEELMAQVRQAGVEDLQMIKKMYMEGDGQFSIIRKDDQEVDQKKSNRDKTI